MKDSKGRIIDSRKVPNPNGPANIEFILREYNKAKAEQDQCKYHRVVSVFILSASPLDILSLFYFLLSAGLTRSLTVFDNSTFQLGTCSQEESKRRKTEARSLAKFTKKLVEEKKTAMPNTKQFTRMLELTCIRVLAKKGPTKLMDKDPEGPANISVILREYKKAKAERDKCKHHRVVELVFII